MGKYKSLFQRLRQRVDYWREVALTEFVADLSQRMEDRELSRAALAERLGKSRAFVTKALRGDSNLTLESLVRFAMAVDGVVHIHIADPDVATTWLDTPLGLGKTKDVRGDIRYPVERVRPQPFSISQRPASSSAWPPTSEVTLQ